jgi:hypothetical protein
VGGRGVASCMRGSAILIIIRTFAIVRAAHCLPAFIPPHRCAIGRSRGVGMASLVTHARLFGEEEAARENVLIILNTDCISPLFFRVWHRAGLRICADGGANRLHDG